MGVPSVFLLHHPDCFLLHSAYIVIFPEATQMPIL